MYSEFHVTQAAIIILMITLYRNGTIQWKSITYYMMSLGVLRDLRITS